MYCPKCGNPHLQAITESEYRTKGYGAGKGCLGYLIFGPIGLICGLCGMGKEKGRTTSYWACNQCGHRFKM